MVEKIKPNEKHSQDKEHKKIKLLLFIAYTFLLLYITLLGRHHYDPLSAVWSGWIIKKNGNHWNFDALGNILVTVHSPYVAIGKIAEI